MSLKYIFVNLKIKLYYDCRFFLLRFLLGIILDFAQKLR
jgi:hypothetical protein